jgi:hypothetical protein
MALTSNKQKNVTCDTYRDVDVAHARNDCFKQHERFVIVALHTHVDAAVRARNGE